MARMRKKLNAIPTPARDTYYDSIEVQGNADEGLEPWFTMGDLTTTNGRTTGLTHSADDIKLQLQVLNANAPTGWVLGRSKAIISSWEMKYRIMNNANFPLKASLYTLKWKENLNYPPGISDGATLTDLLDAWLWNQYNVTNSGPRTVDFGAFKLSDVSMFNKYLKVVKIKSINLQPGQYKCFKKFKRKPTHIDTSQWYITGSSPFYTSMARKGSLAYMWRFHTPLLNSASSAFQTQAVPDFSMVTYYHYRMTYLANDSYNMIIGPSPTTGLTLHTIYPGTSTAGALAPAD